MIKIINLVNNLQKYEHWQFELSHLGVVCHAETIEWVKLIDMSWHVLHCFHLLAISEELQYTWNIHFTPILSSCSFWRNFNLRLYFSLYLAISIIITSYMQISVDLKSIYYQFIIYNVQYFCRYYLQSVSCYHQTNSADIVSDIW